MEHDSSFAAKLENGTIAKSKEIGEAPCRLLHGTLAKAYVEKPTQQTTRDVSQQMIRNSTALSDVSLFEYVLESPPLSLSLSLYLRVYICTHVCICICVYIYISLSLLFSLSSTTPLFPCLLLDIFARPLA